MSTSESKTYRTDGVFCAVERTDAPDGWQWITVTLPAEFAVYFANLATEFWGTQETLAISFSEPRTTLPTRPHSRSSGNG